MNQFLRKIGNPKHDILIYTDALMARGDMEMVDPAEAAEILGQSLRRVTANIPASVIIAQSTKTGDDDTTLTPEERMVKIIAAVATIPVEAWGKGFGGKAPAPKVGDVSTAVGFKVSAAEVAAAVSQSNPQVTTEAATSTDASILDINLDEAPAPGADPATETTIE